MAGTSGADYEVVAIPTLARWADAIATMRASEPLPARVVLVPGEAHAHALRVELAARHPRVLAGTRFLTAAAAARAVLEHAGIGYTLGEEKRRPLRIRKCLRTGISLTSYRAGELVTPGWEEAFASSIEQLESAALRPEDLERLCDPRANDLAAIWCAVDSDAGSSLTVPRILSKAAALLRDGVAAWPFDCATLATVSLGIDTAHARLLSTIPRLTFGVVPGRPARRRSVERIRALLGNEVAEQIARVETDAQEQTELAVLGEYLFEDPARIAAARRRRSCRHRRARVPDPPVSPVTRDPPGGGDAVLRPGRAARRRKRPRSRLAIVEMSKMDASHRLVRRPALVRSWPCSVGTPFRRR